MRADRLINILTTLQARGRATASGLAEENQVSLRTIYRDIGALAMAGIPVYAERGSQGGYLLLNGYKVQLNGMSAGEASALFLSGLGNTATGLGLDAAILRAEKKFAAALPEAMRNDILGSRTRHPRIYKIMRIQLLEVIDGSFAALEDFNLASYWEANTERLDKEIHTVIAHIRVSPLGLRILPELCQLLVP